LFSPCSAVLRLGLAFAECLVLCAFLHVSELAGHNVLVFNVMHLWFAVCMHTAP